ncbi:MAG: hypothetical protein J5I92_15320 [Thiogranum sp.]|nr:hypothetical protein [Thiogranum sp.]
MTDNNHSTRNYFRHWRSHAALICFFISIALLGCREREYAVSNIQSSERLIPSINSEEDAVDAMAARIALDKLYSDWTTLECLQFSIDGQDPHYFDLSVHEKHGGGCPGDPLTWPTVDRFRLYRDSNVLLWYDIANDRYLLYDTKIISNPEVAYARRMEGDETGE